MALRAAEQHVLDEVRETVAFGGLVARADARVHHDRSRVQVLDRHRHEDEPIRQNVAMNLNRGRHDHREVEKATWGPSRGQGVDPLTSLKFACYAIKPRCY